MVANLTLGMVGAFTGRGIGLAILLLRAATAIVPLSAISKIRRHFAQACLQSASYDDDNRNTSESHVIGSVARRRSVLRKTETTPAPPTAQVRKPPSMSIPFGKCLTTLAINPATYCVYATQSIARVSFGGNAGVLLAAPQVWRRVE